MTPEQREKVRKVIRWNMGGYTDEQLLTAIDTIASLMDPQWLPVAGLVRERKSLRIAVCVVEPTAPFICDAECFLIHSMVEEIERDLRGHDEPWWPEGAVTVACTVQWSPAEMDYSGDDQRVAIPAYWDISDVTTVELPAEMPARAEGVMRDPRVDPKDGDQLKFASSIFTVKGVAHGRVTYDVSGWMTGSLTLRQWLEYSKKWEVIHVAD